MTSYVTSYVTCNELDPRPGYVKRTSIKQKGSAPTSALSTSSKMSVSKTEFHKMKSEEKSNTLFDMLCRTQSMIKESDVKADVRAVASKVNKVNDKVDEIADKVGRLDAEMTELKTTVETTGAELAMVKEKVDASLSATSLAVELDDIRKRKRNLIIYGLKESVQHPLEDRKEEDHNQVRRLMHCFASIPGMALANQFKLGNRLGARRDDRPRPLLVEMHNEDIKDEVIANLKILKGKAEWNNVFVSMDRTQNQRENDKRVRLELNEKRLEKNQELTPEEKNDFEFVVLGRPGQYRLRKVKKRNASTSNTTV